MSPSTFRRVDELNEPHQRVLDDGWVRDNQKSDKNKTWYFLPSLRETPDGKTEAKIGVVDGWLMIQNE